MKNIWIDSQLKPVARCFAVSAFGLILCFCLLFPGSGFAQEPEEPLTIGMAIQTNPKIQYESLSRFAEYLASATGRLFAVKLFDNYYSVVNDFDHDALDIAIVTPLVYSLCMDDPDLTYLATDIIKDKAVYQALLIADKAKGIKSIKDLKGKKVGFVDRYSVSGYVIPAARLKDNGLVENGKLLYEPVFLGSHEKAVRALLNGHVDAVGTFEHIFDHSKNDFGTGQPVSRDSFEVVAVFPEEIPNDALVCRSALGEATITALKTAVEKFDLRKEKADSPLQAVISTRFKLDNQTSYAELGKFLKTIMADEK
jgi:phosphonate transport system substrate-binding protein